MKPKWKVFWLVVLLVNCMVYPQEETTEIGTTAVDIPVELVTLEGVVQSVEEAPCSYTTGTATTGMHLRVQRFSDGQLIQVHLGPVWAVSIWTEGILGQPAKLVAFRTNKLPERHFIAKELAWDGQKAVFRDGYLKPFWADRYGKEIW